MSCCGVRPSHDNDVFAADGNYTTSGVSQPDAHAKAAPLNTTASKELDHTGTLAALHMTWSGICLVSLLCMLCCGL